MISLSSVNIGFGRAKGRGSINTAINYYVNSLTGSDTNDGLTTATPFATLSALGDPVEGTVINIARGTTYKEQWPSPSYTPVGEVPINIMVKAYGTGKMPILDASDVITGTWTQPDAINTPNLWSINVTHNLGGGYVSVWADDVRLRWYIDTTSLNTSAAVGFSSDATFTAATPITITIYSDTDPNSNGVVYEYNARDYGMYTGQNWNVYNIHTRRNAHDNGSFVMNTGSNAYGCIFEDGVKHNAFGSKDTMFKDCITWKHDWPERTNHIGIVGFDTDASNGSFTLDGCIAIGEEDKLTYALDNGKGIDAFYFHTDGVTGHNFDTVTVNNCSAKYMVAAVSPIDVDIFSCSTLYVEDCGGLGSIDAAVSSTLRDPYINQVGTFKMNRPIQAGGSDILIDGLRMYIHDGFPNDGLIYLFNSGTFTLNNSAIRRTLVQDGFTWIIRSTAAAAGLVTVTNSIFSSETSNMSFIETTSASLSSDNNVFSHDTSSTMDFGINVAGTSYADYAAYQTATGNDANSIVIASGALTDPANGDFTAGVNVTNGAGIINTVTYTAIPTTTELGNM